MEGRYHKRVISGFLDNLIGTVGRSSPAADAIAEWVENYGAVIGIEIDDNDLLSDEKRRRRVRRRRSKVSRAAWCQLVPAVSAARKKFRSARPGIFDRNLHSLGK